MISLSYVNVINRAGFFFELFLLFVVAYVNGQRQGKIMEKPFSIGDCIAMENLFGGSSSIFQPILDVESEINLVLNSKRIFEENQVGQRMKEMGLER